MVKKGSSFTVILLVLVLVVVVVADGSDGVHVKLRKLVGLKPDNNNTTANSTIQISPSPGPIPSTGSIRNDVNLNVTVPEHPQIPVKNTTKVDPNDSGSASAGSNQEGTDEKCAATSNKCTAEQKDMIACLLPNGLQEFSLLVQNEGDSSLKVNISVSASVKADVKELQIPKHRSKKINVSVNGEGISTIKLHAVSGECVLHTGVPVSPVPKSNYFPTFPQMPSYTTLASPIYGAYFLFVVALIIGGSWACCKFGKRGQQHGTGVPYQELEMGSTSVVNVESADGWDNSWDDDDWDEDQAVKSPGRQQTGNLSANGLTSRPPSKDEWGNDWDD